MLLEPGRPDAPPPARDLVPPRRSALVGRARELATLTQTLGETARLGRGAIVLVGGEPGIGKTRLLLELGERARRDGWLVLLGRAYDFEGMPPYLPFIEALRDYVRGRPPETLQAQLGDGGPEVGLLVPELHKRLPQIPAKPSLDPDGDRFRLFEAVCDFLLNISRSTQGLLFCLDDLHSADRSTLLLLQHLARRLTDAPAVVVGTYRTVNLDQSHPLFDVLPDLVREPFCDRIVLPSLPMAGSTELIERLAGGPVALAVADAIHRRAGGNPFYVEELARHLQAEGHDLADPRVALEDWSLPEGVRQVIGKRVSRLAPEASRALQAAAVLGERFSFELLAVLLGSDDTGVVEALEEAVRAGVIREDDGAYRFTHALVRQALHEELSLPRRQRLHRAAARAIETAYVHSLDAHVAELAVHYRLARTAADTDRAIEYSVRAGEVDRAVFAYEEAAQHWQAALDLLEERADTRTAPPIDEERRARLLERLGDLLFTTGLDSQKGIEYLERALNLYDTLGRQPDYGGNADSRGDGSPGRTRHATAAGGLEPKTDHTARGYVYMALASGAMYALRTEQGLALSRRGMEIGRRLGNQALWATAAGQHAYHLMGAGRLAEAQALLEQAWEAADRLNDLFAAWFVAWCGCVCTFDLFDVQGVERWAHRELAKTRLAQAPDQRLALQEWLARARVEAGDLQPARALLAEASARANADALENLQTSFPFRAGEWAQAAEPAARGRQAAHKSGAWGREAEWLRCLAQVHRVRGEIASAEALLQESLAIVQGDCFPSEVKTRAELALLYAESGRGQEAQSHLAHCREILGNGENWRALAGRAALAEAVAAAPDGQPDTGEADFQRAIAIFQRHRLLWDEAEAWWCWGRALLAAGKDAEAADKLDRSLAIYRGSGAGDCWAQRVLALKRPRQRRATHRDGLTERELEVLRLLAAGRSSRQIAAQLVLSVRTVERHITNIYRKIDARTRAQATAYALKHDIG